MGCSIHVVYMGNVIHVHVVLLHVVCVTCAEGAEDDATETRVCAAVGPLRQEV